MQNVKIGEFLEENQVNAEYSDDLKLAILSAQLCQDKLAENVFILGLKNIESAPTDYFVICSCDSGPQVDSICDLITRTTSSYKLLKPHIEGRESLEWVLLDYFDVVVHLMLKEVRELYKLEKLWGDAEFYTVNDEAELLPLKFDEILRIFN